MLCDYYRLTRLASLRYRDASTHKSKESTGFAWQALAVLAFIALDIFMVVLHMFSYIIMLYLADLSAVIGDVFLLARSFNVLDCGEACTFKVHGLMVDLCWDVGDILKIFIVDYEWIVEFMIDCFAVIKNLAISDLIDVGFKAV